MYRPISWRAALALACAAALAAPAAAKPHAEVIRLAKKAASNTMACYGEKKDEACVAFIAGIDAAMAAKEATASDRHGLLKEKLHVIGVRGHNLLEKGQTAAALRVLREGEALMLDHLGDGAHRHTLVDNIRLQKALALTHLTLGNQAQADTVTARVRDATQWAVDNQAASMTKSNETVRRHWAGLAGNAIIESEDYERELAELLIEKAKQKSTAASSARAYRLRAIDHLDRAFDWTMTAGKIGISTFADAPAPIRLAEIRHEQGMLRFNLDQKKEAGAAFKDGSSWACKFEVVASRSEDKFEQVMGRKAGALCEQLRMKTDLMSLAR